MDDFSVSEKHWEVTTPNRVLWTVRFHSFDSGWKRVLALKKLEDTKQNRERMQREGWAVNRRTS